MSEKVEGKTETSSSAKAERMDGPPSPKRIKLTDNVNDMKKMNRDLLLSKFQEQDKYINYLEDKVNQTSNAGELTSLRESEEKLKLQQQESTRRENVLVMRLATKEQEMQELLTQIHDLKQAQNPAGSQLRSTLLDPAVNVVFQRMKSELDETKEKLEQAQNDLSAWKFTPDSVTGKKLMAKCRMLIQENKELGKQLSQGRVAQLEAELALQKRYSEELKTSEAELNEFVIQLDEEVEGMQSTILTLQQQLKGVKTELVEAKQSSVKHVEQILVLERNLDLARTQPPSPVDVGKPPTVEDMQCDTTDRTEAENQESGHKAMEIECSNEVSGENNMKHEDSKFQNVESELHNVKPVVENVSSVCNNVYSDAENVQFDVKNVQPEGRNVQVQPDVKDVQTVVKDVPPDVKDVQTVVKDVQPDVKDVPPDVRNVLSEVKNVQLEIRDVQPEFGNIQPEPEVRNVLTEANIVFSEVRIANPKENEKFEPNLRKSAGTPPCSTFSISQILGGEPKRTPSPDIPPGGDAVVTKIPYIGGYSDPTADSLRTEGSGLLNGDGKDGTPPIVT